MDLLQQEAPERLDARSQERAVERHINALEWDRCKATLEVNRLGLGLGLFGALPDDLYEMLLDIFEGHGLHERLDVDFLCLEVIGDIGQAVKSSQLGNTISHKTDNGRYSTYITSAHVLHIGHVVVDNL